VRFGVLTGGGDCPGLNAVIRAAVRKGIGHYGHSFIGFRDGWRGVLNDGEYEELTIESTKGILHRGGTILGSSRTNPFKRQDGPGEVRERLARLSLDGLIAIGGEDTLGAANRLHQEGIPVLGVPKTIDNDLGATDQTFGFDTAMHVATEAIDRLHTTAESHQRVLIVEVMGRHAGWIALYSGVAGGADVILVPEEPFDLEDVCRHIRSRAKRGRRFSIVVAAEGAVPINGSISEVAPSTDEFGHARLGGIGHWLEREIERRAGVEARATVLGHIQRGGTPTAFDRVLATRLGLAAIDAAHDRRWGMMPALRGTRIELVPLADAVAGLRTVSSEEYEAFSVLFG
jgi:phosphofructokinase-like protein